VILYRNLYQILLALLFVAAVSGAMFFWAKSSASPGLEVQLPTATPTPELKVYITGAVNSPGVYSLKPGDRVQEALQAAGGATQEADLTRVNLARRLQDEDFIYVPRVGETVVPTQMAPPGQGQRLDLNAATVEELQVLPGIGQAKAQAIVDYRQRNGGFQSVEQLLEVPGIGPATLDNIREMVTVTPP